MQSKEAKAAMFAIFALMPGLVLTNVPMKLCFTSSERFDGSDWILADFDDYMLSRCPPYDLIDPGDLYPNATAGRW